MEHILIELVNDLQLKRVVEVGVFGGNLTKRVLMLCPSVEMYYCVDPWKVYIEYYDRPPHARELKQEWWETLYNKVAIMQRELFPERMVIYRETSIQAAKHFPDKVDVVYIDAIHDIPNIVNDMYHWLPHLCSNGIMSGHDFSKSYAKMAQAIASTFGPALNLLIVDPSRSPLSYKNTAQGGNWWAFVEDGDCDLYRRRIEENYGEYIQYA